MIYPIGYYLFGSQYIIVEATGSNPVHFVVARVKQYGKHYISNIDCYNFIIKPNGEINGPCYINSWRPVTPDMEKFYNGDSLEGFPLPEVK